jgi:hypothetical protein
MTEYSQAKLALNKLHRAHPAGSLISTRGNPDDILVVVSHALDSEDLSRHTVVLHPDEREMWSVPSDQIRPAPDQTQHAAAIASAKSSFPVLLFAEAQKVAVHFDRNRVPRNASHIGSVVRHYKGGIYSILSILGISNPNPNILYVSHADGVAWLRPWSEFGDGRFEPSHETVLAPSEVGLDVFCSSHRSAELEVGTP